MSATSQTSDLRLNLSRALQEQERARFSHTTREPELEAADRRWLAGMRLRDRLVLRTVRRPVNRFAKSLLITAHERGIIDSQLMHALAGIVDRRLWPERNA